tara:strand:- start:2152 stop:2598 length:447 start_codon:yes stop_codon:yes gene_type:complete
MTELEFKAFIGLVDNAYPKQKLLNNTQKGFFWLAIQSYKMEDCVKAFSVHTQSSEWKPQVCDIVKNLSDSDLEVKKYLLDFFNRKDVQDKTAKKVYQMMGGLKLARSCEKDYNKIEERFIELYRSEKTKKNFEGLPSKVKNKLIGAIK